MQTVIFADPSNGHIQLLTDMNDGDKSVTILNKTSYPSDENKAAMLIKLAPASATVNGTLMTALKCDTVRGVMGLYNKRKARPEV